MKKSWYINFVVACFIVVVVIGVSPKRTADAQGTNIALGADTSGSDPGWGGGSNAQEIVDGSTYYTDTWAHGLAFTGGTGEWGGQSCGTRQATVDFGAIYTFDHVLVWHHGNEHVPNTYHLEYWDGSNWVNTGGTSTVRWDLQTPPQGVSGWGAVPTEHIFPAVTGSKVRFVLNNCDITHGWIYEFEVFASLIEITALQLNDIDDQPLIALSADEHNYRGGYTIIHGTITIEGDEQEELIDLYLEIVKNGQVVATMSPSTKARNHLLNRRFGSDRKVEITQSGELFRLHSDDAKNVGGNTNQDEEVTLRVVAISSNGTEIIAPTTMQPLIPILVRLDDQYPRYGERDSRICIGTANYPCGGDDWVRPSVRQILEHFTGIMVNDISNMNGGFFPIHSGHRDGSDIDGYFPGYEKRDEAAAIKMINYLNDPTYGSSIEIVWVTFVPQDGDPFYDAIKDVTLMEGTPHARPALSVINDEPGHETHFHWRFKK